MSNPSSQKAVSGFVRLSWLQRIGFGAGDLAQNLIYQTICMYLLFFYTDVYVLGGDAARSAGLAGTMFLIVRLVDVVWDPLVGTFVDKHTPRWGKYRSYLILGGIPLTILAILCFWDGFKPSLLYAYITYVGMSMLYTLINVPYGALNSSLTRDTDEITVLTSTRMFMANVGGLCVSAGVPLLVATLAGAELPWQMAFFMGLGSLPSFIFMPLVPAIKRKVGKKNMFYIFLSVAILGMVLLYAISRVGSVQEHIVLVYIAQFVKSTGVIVATGYMWALIPEVISYGEYTTGRRISGIVNALTGIFFKAGMALGGVVPGFVLWLVNYKPTDEASNLPKDSHAWFVAMLIFALVGLALLVFCFSQTKERVVMDEAETKNVRVSDLWKEFVRNRPLRVVALFFVTAFAMMSVGNAAGAYFMNNMEVLPALAQEGIRWLVCVIPAMLLLLAMWIISKYELTDEKVDEINREIERRDKR
ncbi:MAG: MFS transporter [Bacteroidaceae bacterium]|nr:MFS transporter [Bacteroidaceae bacterium]